MVTIRTDKDEMYRISFNQMLVQYQGRMYYLKGIFKLCKGLPFETLIHNEEGKEHFFLSKGNVIEINEE